ncbi:MAG: VTT domain-containing protein [Rhodobacteraceae bacterium]|nr:VTT domain-containing protein [Paracoccaceae bacterium]
MSDQILGLVVSLGPWFLALITALGCVGVPVPASLSMVMAGTFIASGEMNATTVVAAALGGAVVGDHIGFLAGRLARQPLSRFIMASPGRVTSHARAQALIARWGGIAVFFSRWLLSPLCPVVNVVAGAGVMAWPRFARAELAGAVVWVGIYTGLGYLFAGEIAASLALLGDALWFLVAAGVAAVLGHRLCRAIKSY